MDWAYGHSKTCVVKAPPSTDSAALERLREELALRDPEYRVWFEAEKQKAEDQRELDELAYKQYEELMAAGKARRKALKAGAVQVRLDDTRELQARWRAQQAAAPVEIEFE
jgi:hypothetical protein